MKWLTTKIRQYNPNSIIVIGNSVAGSVPELFLKNSKANIAIIGEGELSTAEVLKKLVKDEDIGSIQGIAFKNKNGRVIINDRRKAIKKLGEFPMINWNFFETEKYFKKSYAAAKALKGKQVRVMSSYRKRLCF